MSKFRVGAPLLAVLLWSATAYAQEKGQMGITMGYPAHIGLIWHVTDNVAVRPELQFAAGSSEVDLEFDEASSSSWSYGIGASALIYLKEWDGVRTYVAPRFTYFKAKSTSDLSGLFGGEAVQRSSSYSVAGLFGAQYALHRRFSVFGEVGVIFTDRNSSTSLSGVRTDSDTWGTTTGAGVVFYF